MSGPRQQSRGQLGRGTNSLTSVLETRRCVAGTQSPCTVEGAFKEVVLYKNFPWCVYPCQHDQMPMYPQDGEVL